jgi:hypothetical protein
MLETLSLLNFCPLLRITLEPISEKRDVTYSIILFRSITQRDEAATNIHRETIQCL